MPTETPKGKGDRRGIQRIDRVGKIDAKWLVCIKASGDADHPLREVGIDAPVASGIRLGQGVASDLTPDAKMIKLGALRPKAGFDMPPALAIVKLREGRAEILLETQEELDLVLASIARDAPPKCRERLVLHDLSEGKFAMVHRRFLRQKTA